MADKAAQSPATTTAPASTTPSTATAGLVEGDSVRCDDGTDMIYRFTGGQLRNYPSPEIARAWNLYWDQDIKQLTKEQCTTIPKGDPMPTIPQGYLNWPPPPSLPSQDYELFEVQGFTEQTAPDPIVFRLPAEQGVSSKTVVVQLRGAPQSLELDKAPHMTFRVKHPDDATGSRMDVAVPSRPNGTWLRVIIPPAPVPVDYVITFLPPTPMRKVYQWFLNLSPPETRKIIPEFPEDVKAYSPRIIYSMLDPLDPDKPTSTKILSMYSDKLVVLDVPPSLDQVPPARVRTFKIGPPSKDTVTQMTVKVPAQPPGTWIRLIVVPMPTKGTKRQVNLTFQPPLQPTPDPASATTTTTTTTTAPAATTTAPPATDPAATEPTAPETTTSANMASHTTSTTPSPEPNDLSPVIIAATAVVAVGGVAAGALYFRKKTR
jgi:hypothetical protein